MGRDVEAHESMFLGLDASSIKITFVEETIGQEESRESLYFHLKLTLAYCEPYNQPCSPTSSS